MQAKPDASPDQASPSRPASNLATVNANQHRSGPRPRVAPNKFVAKRLTQAGKDLVQLLVWEGVAVSKAHERLNLSRSWVAALAASPPVIAHMNEQLEVRRKGERPRNFHRLTELRDQDKNMAAAVSAIKVLEQLGDEAGRPGGAARDISPGYVIQVKVVNQPPAGPFIEGTANELKQVQQVKGDTAIMSHKRGDAQTDDDVLWIDGRGEGDHT